MHCIFANLFPIAALVCIGLDLTLIPIFHAKALFLLSILTAFRPPGTRTQFWRVHEGNLQTSLYQSCF